MQFGKVPDPEKIDFTLPEDHPSTLLKGKPVGTRNLNVYVGCAKWNKTDLKNFYPRGTKDELAYYSSQYNSIELNASFYRLFPKKTYEGWRDKTPEDFGFFPKLSQEISHFKRLKDTEKVVEEYLDGVLQLGEKLLECFLQLHDNFSSKDFDRVIRFCDQWPREIPLAIELRHTAWFNDEEIFKELYGLLTETNTTNIITDTAGRRDIMHMCLTSDRAFIRFVGANHHSDYKRLDDWVDRLESWTQRGLKNIFFFVHQNVERESPVLAAYFIRKMNERLKLNLRIPKAGNAESGLF